MCPQAAVWPVHSASMAHVQQGRKSGREASWVKAAAFGAKADDSYIDARVLSTREHKMTQK